MIAKSPLIGAFFLIQCPRGNIADGITAPIPARRRNR